MIHMDPYSIFTRLIWMIQILEVHYMSMLYKIILYKLRS